MAAPVALFVFNRPDKTQQVFDRIAAARPPRLLVVADGPRPTRPGDPDACAAARRIIERIDWPCNLQRLYADQNLGCKQRVSSGLDWVFGQCERAIILEDDIVPDLSFFGYCDDLLDRYADDRRIMMISGFNPAGQWKPDRQSYHFTYCGSIWGWASWRRAWNCYDVNMALWANPEVRDRVRDVLGGDELFRGRAPAYQRVFDGQVDTWDMQWSVARLAQSGLSVAPALNLIANIGFGPDATHTVRPNQAVESATVHTMPLPLRPPPCVAVDRDYDREFTRLVMGTPRPVIATPRPPDPAKEALSPSQRPMPPGV